jgi:hypothetical protein
MERTYVTEEEYIDLAWRAHVGGLVDRMNLVMAKLKLSDGWNDSIVLAFAGITMSGMRMAEVMERSLSKMPVYIAEGIHDMEDRVLAMCDKPLRSEDFPMHFLDPRKLDYRPFNLDFKHHNKVAIGRMRNYRGPPPKRHK